MSRYDSFRRFAALAACVGSTVAVAALGAASPAGAATCVKPSSRVFGSGSAFQHISQEDLIASWPAHSKCSEKPEPTTLHYTQTSSGKGLEVFGAGNVKDEFALELLNRKDLTVKALEEKSEVCEPKINKAAATHEPSGKCLDLYIGTDDAPSSQQLENMTGAAVGKTYKKTNRGAVVVPYAEGPLAVGFSLPAGCKISEGKHIYLNNVTLGQLYEGERAPSGEDPGGVQAQAGYAKNTWGALLNQLGYSKVAKESELAENKFAETAPEESLTRYSETKEEEVTVHSKSEIEKNENAGGKKVKVAHQEKKLEKGENCANAQIKPQARGSESGTSYAFKNYLWQINKTVWTGFNTDSTTWPEKSNVLEKNKETSGKGEILQEKGSQLAEAGSAIPGSVSYQDTADQVLEGGNTENVANTTRPMPASSTLEEVVQEGEAENLTTKTKEKILTLKAQPVKSLPHQIAFAYIQDTGCATTCKSGGKEPTKEAGGGFAHSEFEDPLTVGTDKANCQRSKLIAGDEGFPLHWTESWQGVLASDPNINKVEPTAYPACALTYDVFWHHYGNVELYGHTKIAEEMAATGKDYAEYISSEAGGQELFNDGYYSGIPNALRSHIVAGVKNIGY